MHAASMLMNVTIGSVLGRNQLPARQQVCFRTAAPGMRTMARAPAVACWAGENTTINAANAAKSTAADTPHAVTAAMASCKAANRTAFIPFLVAGDPSLSATASAIKALDGVGADVIELGVPYSDPLADGPTIQAAATRALQQGVVLDQVIDVVRQVSPSISAPIVMFTYFNPIMARGLDKFCEQISSAGASGLLVPDIPLEETEEIRKVATSYGLDLVLLATPTTPAARMAKIADATQGFVYLVSVTGVTGMRGTNETRVEGLIETLRENTDKSIAVGFGVSGPEQARQIKAWGADGVIVGRAMVKALGESGDESAGLAAMEGLARSIREAI